MSHDPVGYFHLFICSSSSFSTAPSSGALILLPAQVCLWIFLVIFFISFQLQNVLVSLRSLYIDISILFIHPCFFTFSTSSFSSLHIFKTTVQVCLVHLPLCLQVHFLLIWFFSSVPCYCFCVPYFVVEHWTFESNNVVTLEIKLSPFPRVC